MYIYRYISNWQAFLSRLPGLLIIDEHDFGSNRSWRGLIVSPIWICSRLCLMYSVFSSSSFNFFFFFLVTFLFMLISSSSMCAELWYSRGCSWMSYENRLNDLYHGTLLAFMEIAFVWLLHRASTVMEAVIEATEWRSYEIKSSSHRSIFLKRFSVDEKRCQPEVQLNEWRINNDQAKSIEIRYKCNTIRPPSLPQEHHTVSRRNAVSSTWSTVLFCICQVICRLDVAILVTIFFLLFFFFGSFRRVFGPCAHQIATVTITVLSSFHGCCSSHGCVFAVMVMATVTVMETTYLKSHLCIL